MTTARSDIAWCPGCGNFAIRDALEKAIRELPVPRKDIVLTSGIGQAAKMPHYIDVNFFNGLHGRSLPLAVGIKLARPDLTVIAYSETGATTGKAATISFRPSAGGSTSRFSYRTIRSTP